MTRLTIDVPPPSPVRSDAETVAQKWQEAIDESVADLPILRRRREWRGSAGPQEPLDLDRRAAGPIRSEAGRPASRPTGSQGGDPVRGLLPRPAPRSWVRSSAGLAETMRPLEDRVLVKRAGAAAVTATGLIIPENVKDNPEEGQVLAIGPGRLDDYGQRVPVDVEVGDQVLFGRYGGTIVTFHGEEYLILSARDVLAVVEPTG